MDGIRKVDLNNKISTLAGNSSAGFAGDGNTALSVLFNNPSDILIDNSGNLFVADYANQRVRRIDAHLPQLTVAKSGTGNGVVLGTLGVNNEINCGNQCSANYLRNSMVTLNAQPDANSTFDGWTGDCSSSTLMMDADKTCSAVFNVNQISNLSNCPTTGVISSDCNAAGLTLQNIQISNAVKVYNGIFTGSVFNQGDIINGQFAASALLTGGNVSGIISGVQNAPAQFLQVQIQSNTQLNHVVIGQDTHITNGATIGLGVQFTSANQIPVAGMDLSSVLPKVESACPQVEGSKSLDLNNIIFTQSGVVLNNLNAIPFMSQNAFALRSESGLLKLDIGDSRFIQRPVKVVHVLNESAVVVPDYVNNLYFLTADHLNVKTHPMLFGICQLYQQFSDWTWTELENGNIRMEKPDQAEWISIRPEWVLTKASADSPRGLQIANSPKRAEILELSYIGNDSDGQLFKQKIISAPVSPDVLYLASDRNQLQWDSGVLNFVYQGQNYRGVLDFVVTKSPASGAFSLELVGGSQDVILIYPSGDRQRLFVLPP